MGIIKPLGSIGRSLDKAQIVELAEANAQEVIDHGQYDMLKVFTELKRYELYLKTVIEKTKQAALEKAIEMGEKNLEIDQAKITISKRTTYDYSSDAKWGAIKEEIDFLAERRKEREALLKKLAPGEAIEIVDETTGEVEEISAPPAETKLGLIVRL